MIRRALTCRIKQPSMFCPAESRQREIMTTGVVLSPDGSKLTVCLLCVMCLDEMACLTGYIWFQ